MSREFAKVVYPETKFSSFCSIPFARWRRPGGPPLEKRQIPEKVEKRNTRRLFTQVFRAALKGVYSEKLILEDTKRKEYPTVLELAHTAVESAGPIYPSGADQWPQQSSPRNNVFPALTSEIIVWGPMSSLLNAGGCLLSSIWHSG